jgi:hypothetical protein
MKFEEVLPALREGKGIRRTNEAWQEVYLCIDELAMQRCQEIRCMDLLQDDWEVVE